MEELKKLTISGFADEIDDDLGTQLKTLTDLGMQKVSSLGSPIGKVDIRDEAGIAKQKEQLESLCLLAKRLDCSYIRVFSFFVEEAEASEMRDRVLQGLKEFIAIAEAHNLILMHENEKGIYGDTIDRNVDLMENLYGDHFKMAFDFANFVQCGQDSYEAWSKLKDYVAYIHIKDALAKGGDNVPFGTGDGQAEKILKEALVDRSYKGFLTLEPHLHNFSTLQSLEKNAEDHSYVGNKATSGAQAYAIQYRALTRILDDLDLSYV
jgi:sugar phosphate isomerase/epimerase